MEKKRRFPLSLNTSSPVYGLGLLTDEPDYRLCWLLNQNFSWGLSKSDDLTVTDKNSPVAQTFACFRSNPDHLPEIRLIGNRSAEGLWLTAFSQIDFLLVIGSQPSGGQFLDDLKNSISTKIPQIRGLFKVPLPSFCYL